MWRSPSGSGVLGVRGALRTKRHSRHLHQYLQICELDPESHEEQLTCFFYLPHHLGGHSDPQSSNTSSIIIPSSHSSWSGDLSSRTPTPASPSKAHGSGRRACVTIWNKYNLKRGDVCLFGILMLVEKEGRAHQLPYLQV